MTFQIVQIVHTDETGDSIHRVTWPSVSLAQQEKDFCIINVQSTDKRRHELAKEADLLVLLQPSDVSFIPIILERKKKNVHTLVEYNDNFYEPQPWSPVAHAWNSYKTWQAYELFIKHCSGVIVTGEGLSNLFKEKCSVTPYILENHLLEIPSLDHMISRKRKNSFGWAGSLGHIADLLSIVHVIKRVLERVPDATFFCMGNESIPEHLSLPQERLKFKSWGTLDAYLSFLEEVQVGVIPLLSTPYNECRSDIKAVEMMSRGMHPCIPRSMSYEKLIQETQITPYSSLHDLEEEIILKMSSYSSEAVSPHYTYVKERRLHGLRSERAALYRKFLPQNSHSSLSFVPGLHDIKHEKESVHHDVVLLAKLQELVQAKNSSEAVQFAETHTSKLCWYPEYYLIFQKVLEEPQRTDCLEEGKKLFPKDIRIHLLGLLRKDAKESVLSEILSLLKSESQNYRNAVSSECDAILPILKDLTESEFKLLVQIHELITAPKLRLAIAHELFKRGDLEGALQHYEKLQSDSAIFESIKTSPLSSGFVAAFVQALKGSLT